MRQTKSLVRVCGERPLTAVTLGRNSNMNSLRLRPAYCYAGPAAWSCPQKRIRRQSFMSHHLLLLSDYSIHFYFCGIILIFSDIFIIFGPFVMHLFLIVVICAL